MSSGARSRCARRRYPGPPARTCRSSTGPWRRGGAPSRSARPTWSWWATFPPWPRCSTGRWRSTRLTIWAPCTSSPSPSIRRGRRAPRSRSSGPTSRARAAEGQEDLRAGDLRRVGGGPRAGPQDVRGAAPRGAAIRRGCAAGARRAPGEQDRAAARALPAGPRKRHPVRLIPRSSMHIRAFVLAFLLAAQAHAAPVRIKLGTLAPQGSTWHQLLLEMGQKWSQASNGQVELKVYAGGTQGNEGEMIRKISIGQLQATAITAIGLHEITPEPQAEDVPSLIDSYEEYDYVHEKLRPKLDDALARKGYVPIHWGEV